jgi:hypothetical protein
MECSTDLIRTLEIRRNLVVFVVVRVIPSSVFPKIVRWGGWAGGVGGVLYVIDRHTPTFATSNGFPHTK